MIKTIIIDDEKHALVTLEFLLKQFDTIDLVGIVQDSTQAKDIIEKEKPDLVFIDIEMPKLNGFDVLAQFDKLPFKVVFTTAYDQYAIKALKMNALDYLLKPIDEEELANAINKYQNEEIFTSEQQIAQVNKFNIGQLSDTLALSTQKGLHFIKIEDIMYFSASGSYTNVKLNNGETHLVSKALINFEDVLQDNPTFFRAHKSHLINLKFISQYIRGEGGEIIMQDKTSIVLSRTKKQDFLNLFKKI